MVLIMSLNNNRQNFQSDIPKGRSTSRIKNASKSQGFANKDLYGPTVKYKASSGTNKYSYRTPNSGNRTYQGRSSYKNNSIENQYKNAGYSKQTKKNARNDNGEMGESTIVKVIIGSILAAVLLAIVIIVALVFMDFRI